MIKTEIQSPPAGGFGTLCLENITSVKASCWNVCMANTSRESTFFSQEACAYRRENLWHCLFHPAKKAARCKPDLQLAGLV